MGTIYQAICNSCTNQFELKKGGGWTWFQKICNTCGKEIKVPRYPPQDAEFGVLLTEIQLREHLLDPSKWSRRSGKFEKSEINLLDSITSKCECGGLMISESDPKIIYRCFACKGTNIDLKMQSIFD